MLSVNKYGGNRAWAYRAITWLTAAQQQLTMTEQAAAPVRVRRSTSRSPAAQNKSEAEFYRVLGDSLAVGVGRARLTNYTEVSASHRQGGELRGHRQRHTRRRR